MGTVYLLNEPKLPGIETLRKCIASPYGVEEVATWEALSQIIQPQQQAVVIFYATAEEIALKAGRVKALSKTAACLVVPPEGVMGPERDLPLDTLLLPASITEQNIHQSLATAMRLSELLSTIEASVQLDEVALLCNRRYFISRLNEEISLSKRHLSPLSCVIIGINYYQVYLDSYGYEFITRYLKHLAGIIQQQIRKEDIIARMDDDEIALLLPRSTEKGARILTDRIIQLLHATPYVEGDQEEVVSVRAGIAGYPLADNTPADADTLIRYAHHALHQARCAKDKTIQLFNEIQMAL